MRGIEFSRIHSTQSTGFASLLNEVILASNTMTFSLNFVKEKKTILGSFINFLLQVRKYASLINQINHVSSIQILLLRAKVVYIQILFKDKELSFIIRISV